LKIETQVFCTADGRLLVRALASSRYAGERRLHEGQAFTQAGQIRLLAPSKIGGIVYAIIRAGRKSRNLPRTVGASYGREKGHRSEDCSETHFGVNATSRGVLTVKIPNALYVK